MECFVRKLLIIFILCWIFDAVSAQVIYQPPAKKLVEFSWASPTTQEYNGNIGLYDSGPFDGISVKPSPEAGGGYIFMVENWTGISKENKKKELDLVRNIAEKSSLKDNFLVLYGGSQMDWFSDDHWNKAESHIRYVANLARTGRFKGILWDPEPYKPGKNPWKMSDQPGSGDRSYYDYYLQVRKRGAQFIRAIQDEFPGLTILSLRELSDYLTGSPFSQGILPLKNPQQSRSDLEEAWWALHLPFTLGILDAIDENVVFIDANEEAYYYTSAIEYYKVRNEIFNDSRALIPPGLHQKFKACYHLGHAVSTDYIAGNWAGFLNGFPYSLSGQGKMLSPAEKARWFEHNMYYALQTSDEYVWLYSEDMNWWTGERVPEGFPEALKQAMKKVENIEPLGFEVEEMLKKAREKAEKAGN